MVAFEDGTPETQRTATVHDVAPFADDTAPRATDEAETASSVAPAAQGYFCNPCGAQRSATRSGGADKGKTVRL